MAEADKSSSSSSADKTSASVAPEVDSEWGDLLDSVAQPEVPIKPASSSASWPKVGSGPSAAGGSASSSGRLTASGSGAFPSAGSSASMSRGTIAPPPPVGRKSDTLPPVPGVKSTAPKRTEAPLLPAPPTVSSAKSSGSMSFADLVAGAHKDIPEPATTFVAPPATRPQSLWIDPSSIQHESPATQVEAETAAPEGEIAREPSRPRVVANVTSRSDVDVAKPVSSVVVRDGSSVSTPAAVAPSTPSPRAMPMGELGDEFARRHDAKARWPWIAGGVAAVAGLVFVLSRGGEPSSQDGEATVQAAAMANAEGAAKQPVEAGEPRAEAAPVAVPEALPPEQPSAPQQRDDAAANDDASAAEAAAPQGAANDAGGGESPEQPSAPKEDTSAPANAVAADQDEDEGDSEGDEADPATKASANQLLSQARSAEKSQSFAEAYDFASQSYDKRRTVSALRIMIRSACSVNRADDARLAYRKVVGSDDRKALLTFCKEREIELLVADPSALPPDELFRQAEAAYAKGDLKQAYALAKDSVRQEKRVEVLEFMTKVACEMSDQAKAQYIGKMLIPPRRAKLAPLCAEHGVTLE